MLWHVDDDGKTVLRLKSVGPSAVLVGREHAARLIDRIIFDLGHQGIDAVSDEFRVRVHKLEETVDVLWRGRVPVGTVPDARDYFVRLSQSLEGR